MIYTTAMLIAIKHSETLPSIKSEDNLVMLSCKVTWRIKYLRIKAGTLRKPENRNPCGTLQKSENRDPSGTLQNLWSFNLAKWWVTISNFHLKVTQSIMLVKGCVTLWMEVSYCGLLRSDNKSKPFFLLYHNDWSSQSWQCDDLGRGSPNH